MNDDTPTPLLHAEGLMCHFGTVKAVDGVDLRVMPGEIYGFLGINGAGKTTTIRMLMGIIPSQAGTITLLGEMTRRTSVRQKQRIGYVSQEQHFYPWMSCRTLGRFVGSMYPSWDAAEFRRLMEIFSVPLDRKVSELSGGMKAKLGLALAIAPRPDLLILDEPTAGLDPVARREFMQIIVAQARQHGRTTLFSSHLVDEVERCSDRIGILHEGRMRFEGPLTELQKEVRELWLPPDEPLPEGAAIWQEEVTAEGRRVVLRAPADWWAQCPQATRALSLEDIFVSCVGMRRLSL